MAIGSAGGGRPVEVAVRRLYQPSCWILTVEAVFPGAKAVECREFASGSNSEDRSIVFRATSEGGSVKVAVARLRQPGIGVSAVGATKLRTKDIHSGQFAGGGNFKNRALTIERAIDSTGHGGAIQVAVRRLDHSAAREFAVGAVRLGAKAVECTQLPRWGDFEYGALVVGASLIRRSVEGSIAGLHERCVGIFAVSTVCLRAETVERYQLTGRGDFEYRATVVHPASECCPVKVPVGGLHECCVGSFAVGAIGLRAKGVERRQVSRCRDFKDYTTVIIEPTDLSCPVEVSREALDNPRDRVGTIREVKVRKGGVSLRG